MNTTNLRLGIHTLVVADCTKRKFKRKSLRRVASISYENGIYSSTVVNRKYE